MWISRRFKNAYLFYDNGSFDCVPGNKPLNETTIKYSSNVLAAVVAVLMSCAVCAIYLIMNDVAFTLKVGVEVCILMYLSFLTSTVGYDKVIQMIQQIRDTKEYTTHE